MGDTHDVGPLELRVLGILRTEEGASVADVRARLAASGSKLAYTTVMTVLSRLSQKGLTVRTREGQRYLYTRADRSRGVLGGMLTRVRRAMSGGAARPLVALLEAEDLSTKELRELRQLIDRKIAEKKKGPPR
jgi:BlaI family transcriptional regulator, penicillinase repressor